MPPAEPPSSPREPAGARTRGLLARRGLRALLALGASLLCAFVALEGLWLACGERVLRAAVEGRSIGILNRWGAARAQRNFGFVVQDLHGDLRSVELLALAAWTLALLCWFVMCVRRRPRYLPLVLLGWWLALELLVAPRLNFPLWNIHYRLVQDVDHRPTETGGRYNSDSLVATPESSEFRPEDLNLLFLGDSFTMGFDLEDYRLAFPTQAGLELERAHPEARLHVANFGWVSSSPLLSYRRLVDLGERYAPDIVVECVDMTDFSDDLRYERMLERRGIYWFYDKLPLTLRLLQVLAPVGYRKLASATVGDVPARRYFVSDAPLEETREWMRPLARSVGLIDEWCRAHGAEFVLVVLPRGYQYSSRESPRNWEEGQYEIQGRWSLEPFRFFDELRAEVAYPVVSLLPDFQQSEVFPTCFEADPHWNAAGHRIAAAAIARALEPIVRARLGR